MCHRWSGWSRNIYQLSKVQTLLSWYGLDLNEWLMLHRADRPTCGFVLATICTFFALLRTLENHTMLRFDWSMVLKYWCLDTFPFNRYFPIAILDRLWWNCIIVGGFYFECEQGTRIYDTMTIKLQWGCSDTGAGCHVCLRRYFKSPGKAKWRNVRGSMKDTQWKRGKEKNEWERV